MEKILQEGDEQTVQLHLKIQELEKQLEEKGNYLLVSSDLIWNTFYYGFAFVDSELYLIQNFIHQKYYII